jgi:hypothetical protein
MSVNPAAQAAQLFASAYGALVTGGSKTLPASTTGHVFTVAGGRVIITSLTGVVTTAIQNQTCTLSVGNTPTGGSAGTTSIATASSVANAALATDLAVPGFSSGSPQALVVGGVQQLGVVLDQGGICLVPAGTIDVTTSATNTGAITWSVTYVPFDAGATVTAL